jgi:phosphatidylglycerol:prolipoprotein diacylglycerol transferase
MAARSNYKFFYQTELSKQQLAALEGYEENEKAKKELKKKIAEAKKSGESFAELEKEYDERFGKTAKEAAKKQADEISAQKKELKAKIKAAKKSGEKDEVTKLKNEYAEKFGGNVTETEEPEKEDGYQSILSEEDDGIEEVKENEADNENPSESGEE